MHHTANRTIDNDCYVCSQYCSGHTARASALGQQRRLRNPWSLSQSAKRHENMSILAAAASLLCRRLISLPTIRAPPSFSGLFATALHTSSRGPWFRGRKKRFHRPPPPFSTRFPLPPTASVCSRYRDLLRTAALCPDDLVRLYVVARCRTEWREHRAAHRSTYQAEQQAVYEKQKARLQVRERLQRIKAGDSAEAATRAALAIQFDPLQPSPHHMLHITTNTPHVSIDLRRTIHRRYHDTKQQLLTLQRALRFTDPDTLASSRTELLCAAYGWQGGPVLDRLFHLRNMYLNAPNMLQPDTLLALHPLHRYLVTGVRQEDERPVPEGARLGRSGVGGSRPALGVYEWWPIHKSDRLRGQSLISGSRWLECYRLLIMERCAVLDDSWRRAYSDMLRQRQIVGTPGEIEHPGDAVSRKQKTEAEYEQISEKKHTRQQSRSTRVKQV